MNDVIRIGALGGLDENGKNLYVVEINSDIFVIECGLSYPNKNTPGIDWIIPDYSYLKDNKNRVRAYIITHGHDDQIGGLPYVYSDVPAPIYASRTTIGMIKQFTSQLKRDVHYDFHEILPTSQHIIAGRKVSFFQTAHSISNSSGVSISTSQGNIVYSGDYIIEYNTEANYMHDLNALGNISEETTLVLLTESVMADHPGYTSPKHKLRPLIERNLRDSHGRHFIAIYNQNIYNIQEVFDIAFEQKKKIALYGKETEKVFEAMKLSDPTLENHLSVISLEDLPRAREADEIILMVGQGEFIFREIALLANNSNEDRRVYLKDTDTFIVACPPAFSVEVLATKAIDDLYRSGVNVINITRKDLSSMHASEEDIKMMISILKPKYYIPVKGEFRHLIANAKISVSMGVKLSHSNVFLLDNGMAVEFFNGSARLIPEAMKTGSLLIDGLGIGDVGDLVISDRKKLSDDGIVVMAIAINKKRGIIVTQPDVQMRGFIFVKDADAIVKALSNVMIEETKKALDEGVTNFSPVQDIIYERCQKLIRRDTGKMPMIVPIIEEIK